MKIYNLPETSTAGRKDIFVDIYQIPMFRNRECGEREATPTFGKRTGGLEHETTCSKQTWVTKCTDVILNIEGGGDVPSTFFRLLGVMCEVTAWQGVGRGATYGM